MRLIRLQCQMCSILIECTHVELGLYASIGDSLSYNPTIVECNGSRVERRTLDYENPGSNPVLRC